MIAYHYFSQPIRTLNLFLLKSKSKKKRSVSGGVEPPILRLTVARLNQLGHETEDLFYKSKN